MRRCRCCATLSREEPLQRILPVLSELLGKLPIRQIHVPLQAGLGPLHLRGWNACTLAFLPQLRLAETGNITGRARLWIAAARSPWRSSCGKRFPRRGSHGGLCASAFRLVCLAVCKRITATKGGQTTRPEPACLAGVGGRCLCCPVLPFPCGPAVGRDLRSGPPRSMLLPIAFGDLSASLDPQLTRCGHQCDLAHGCIVRSHVAGEA
jgi:hypothetical protein